MSVEKSNGIPIIDFASYDSVNRNALSEEICDTLRTAGFLYLENHGIPNELVEEVFSKSREFFHLSTEEKMKILRPESFDVCTGYVRIGQERLNTSSTLEVREAFDIVPNSIPEFNFPAGFSPSLLALDAACRELALKVLHCIAIGLRLSDENFFLKCHQGVLNRDLDTNSGCLFRTLHYPPSSVAGKDDNGKSDGKVRCGTHSDYGSLTLLFQDDIGGLEIESDVKDVFVPVTPIPGAVLVNIGDLLQQWTSDELRATRHRVLLNDASKSSKARQSIAMFIHPDGDTVVESLTANKKYPPILAKDHLISRYEATYG